MVTTIAVLPPPTLLSANRTSLGVLLQWLPPLEEFPPLTSFVLQAKRGKGEWVTIDREIAVNVTELIVQGLVKVNRVKYWENDCLVLNVAILCHSFSLGGSFSLYLFPQDSNYELRLLSRRDKLVSVPSDSVVISTEGEAKSEINILTHN